MPYDKYVKLFTEMDILLDQTNSYGMGMNAELGLMKGKVVFTGNEPENRSVLGFYTIPAINANSYYSHAEGRYLQFEEANEAERSWLDLYEALQYNSIFDKSHRNENLFPVLK